MIRLFRIFLGLFFLACCLWLCEKEVESVVELYQKHFKKPVEKPLEV